MNEKVNDVKDKVLDKADALCSKLPLDKINQKLIESVHDKVLSGGEK